MSRITKPMRGQRPTKRLDLSDVKEALRDTRQWTALGIVAEGPDGSPHWEVVGDNADVMVEVVIQPDQVPLFCRLAAGMWIVPDVGDEVAVIVPAGELDFMPVITCILSHALPTAQGPQPQRIVIVRGEVLIHDGAGGAVPLAYKSDVEAVEAHVVAVDDRYATHIHNDSTSAATKGPVKTGSILPSGGSPPFADGLPLDSVDAATIVGTTVLKAK